jgi:hypothetical protein
LHIRCAERSPIFARLSPEISKFKWFAPPSASDVYSSAGADFDAGFDGFVHAQSIFKE